MMRAKPIFLGVRVLTDGIPEFLNYVLFEVGREPYVFLGVSKPESLVRKFRRRLAAGRVCFAAKKLCSGEVRFSPEDGVLSILNFGFRGKLSEQDKLVDLAAETLKKHFEGFTVLRPHEK